MSRAVTRQGVGIGPRHRAQPNKTKITKALRRRCRDRLEQLRADDADADLSVWPRPYEIQARTRHHTEIQQEE